MLDDGRNTSISEMAAAEKLDRGYLGRLPQLTLLAPNTVESIVQGKQPEGITLPRLLEPPAFESSRCVVPGLDGAVCPQGSKDAPWAGFFTGSARMTEAAGRTVERSQPSLRALATRDGINPKTIAKRKKTETATDRPTTSPSPSLATYDSRGAVPNDIDWNGTRRLVI